MYAVMCVLDDPEKLNDVLVSWQAINIRGVTVFESTGMYRVTRPHIPMRYTFSGPSELGNLTLFTVVQDEETIQRCLVAVEAVVGDFNLPHTGIFVSWPLGVTKGISGKLPYSEKQAEE